MSLPFRRFTAIIGLNAAYDLGINTTNAKNCYLTAENPIALLKGNRLLSEYGLRNGNEVIKTPLAAEIVEPGRAYFQVGNNEIFDLFQSAYSGATVPEGNDSKDRVFALYERNLWGRKELK